MTTAVLASTKPQEYPLKTSYSHVRVQNHNLFISETAPAEILKSSRNPDERAFYFNNRTLSIRTFHEGKHIAIDVQGRGREEAIRIHVNEGEATAIDDPGVLTMNGTMKPANMYSLEQRTHQELPPEKGEFSMGVIRHYNSADKNIDAKTQIQSILHEALSQGPMPTHITARLLTNDQHWQLVILDLTEGLDNPKLQIINSTNMTRQMGLADIQSDYYRIIGETVNEVLAAKGGRVIPQDEIEYMQGLQYGNMGCGIAADLNYRLWREGVFDESRVFRSNDIAMTTEYEQVIVDGETFTFPVTKVKPQASLDRSLRVSKLDETVRRVELFDHLSTLDNIRGELLIKRG